MTERRFTSRAVYTSHGWFAQVYSGEGQFGPYLQRARMTHRGAAFAAWRLARKLNRLEKRGALQ